MKNYQLQLTELLSRDGWEVESVDDQTDWWSAEQWIIASRRENFGLKLWVDFLVDPQYTGNKKSSAVWAISACLGPPSDRLVAEDGIVMDLAKGEFRPKLEQFAESVTALRRSLDVGSQVDA